MFKKTTYTKKMSFLIRNYNFRILSSIGLLMIILFFAISTELSAQEPPPRPLQVTVNQNLAFGAFAQGAVGGTISINPANGRSSSGDIILLNLGYTFSAAIYKLVANAGTVVSILNGPNVSLTGSSGGSMTLHIGASDPVWPFVITTVPPAYTLMNVGGTLSVGNPGSNPPGNYSGTFYITFVQE
jgi:hypothetical protein